MIRATFRLAVRLGLLAGLGYVVVKVLQQRERASAPIPAAAPTWPPVTPPPAPVSEPAPKVDPEPVKDEPRPEPSAAPVAPPQPTPPRQATPSHAWVEPASDGLCPQTHPIRAKLSSKIFHLPGMFAYERTKPDRCYATESAAEADGFRKAKR